MLADDAQHRVVGQGGSIAIWKLSTVHARDQTQVPFQGKDVNACPL
jgi:hypothetical protein